MPMTATILIVDDAPAGRDTLEELLLSPDYHLEFACDGHEALAQAEAVSPDLILLDVMMPGMDGFEVCQRLRANPRLAEVPIIMVTALDDRDSRLRGIEAGADDFVTKPFDRDELRARVRSVTRLNRYRHLLAERAQFEWVVEEADDGYLMVSEDDAVLYANSRARLYLGITAHDGRPIDQTFMALASRQYRCEPEHAWSGWPDQPALDLLRARYLVRPESPTALNNWVAVTVLDQPAGMPARRLIRLRDVTAQMMTQREMWTFHAMITHKLRTPLGIMLMSMDVLREDLARFAPDEVCHTANSAARNLQRLQGEIEDILEYIGVSALADSDAGATLEGLDSLVAHIAAELGLGSVTLSGDRALWSVRTVFSRRALEIVLWELLENAKKFHPRQSPVVEIAVARAGERAVSLRVADDGLTLSPEQLARAWMPYYQAEKDFTGQVAGTGLGLSMVASLVWEAGGTCRLYNRDSTPGVVVELILPIAPGTDS